MAETGALHAATALHYLAAGVLTWPTIWVYLVSQIVSGFFAGIAFLTFGWWAYCEVILITANVLSFGADGVVNPHDFYGRAY